MRSMIRQNQESEMKEEIKRIWMKVENIELEEGKENKPKRKKKSKNALKKR